MPQHVLTNARIFVAGYDLTGDHNQIGLDYGAEMKDGTVFGLDTRKNVPGLLTINANGGGFWQAGVNLLDEALFAQIGLSNQLATLFATGITEGTQTDKGFGFLVSAGRYAPFEGGQVGEMHRFALSMASRKTPLCRAIPLKDFTGTALTGTGSGTGFQLGSVSASQKLYAGLHVLDVQGTGTPTITVTIQSDDNAGFTSATTRVTFNAMTAIGAQYATPVAGAITDDRWRASWTISGTSPQFKGLVWIAIQ
jgi:hypothetical protein